METNQVDLVKLANRRLGAPAMTKIATMKTAIVHFLAELVRPKIKEPKLAKHQGPQGP